MSSEPEGHGGILGLGAELLKMIEGRFGRVGRWIVSGLLLLAVVVAFVFGIVYLRNNLSALWGRPREAEMTEIHPVPAPGQPQQAQAPGPNPQGESSQPSYAPATPAAHRRHVAKTAPHQQETPSKSDTPTLAPPTSAQLSVTGDCNGVIVGSDNKQSIDCSKHYEGAPQRHLSEKQIAAIKAVAREMCNQHKKISVTAANSNNEAQIYAGDFVEGLNEAGCDADLELPIPGLEATAMGIIVGVRPWPTSDDDLKANNPDAYSIRGALSAASIEPKLAPLAPRFFEGSKFILAIGGAEPPNVQR